MLTITLKKNQNGRDIHVKMNKKQDVYQNVNVTSFLDLPNGNVRLMVFA